MTQNRAKVVVGPSTRPTHAESVGDGPKSQPLAAGLASTEPPVNAALSGRIAPAGTPGNSAAATLLRLESELRQLRTLKDFQYFVANELRVVTRSQQTFVFLPSRGAKPQVVAVSAMAVVDRSAPLIAWIETLVDELAAAHGLGTTREFEADSFLLPRGIAFPGYPLRFLAWVPFVDLDGRVIGGILQARLQPWSEADLVVSRHLASACGHSLMVLTNEKSRWRLPHWTSRRGMLLAGAAILVTGFLPVSMTALAPVEVSPQKAFVVTAPVDGVIEQILVEPNALVKKDQSLVRMADTVLKNRVELAEREVFVADAKVKKASQLAFVDIRGRHELGVAHAELQLRHAELDYARQLLDRSNIKAERDGVAFFTDPKDLIGRPVAVGERLMELADPLRLEFRIDLPVADAIVLNDGARVKIFLDSDPLNPVEARLLRADFQARPRENQQLAFRLIAERPSSDTRPLRLGVRGTAQIYGDRVPLAFYLFRRPISAARQWFGV